MERSRSGQGPDGLRRRRVHMRPGVVLEIVPPGGQKVLDKEEERIKRDAALSIARCFFVENAQSIAFLMSGEVEDRDEIPDDGLRAVTLELMDAGVGSADVVSDVMRALRERPYRGGSNTGYEVDAARAYGRLLEDDRERLKQDRINAEAAARAAQMRGPQS